MNYDYYEKVLALPIKSHWKGVLRTLAYHCNPKLDNLCIPSWDTIQSESSVSRDVISYTLALFQELGILVVRHRGDIETGKKANEYFFDFDGLGFYKKASKWIIRKEKLQELKERLANAKRVIDLENVAKGKKRNTTFLDKSRYQTTFKNPDTRLIVSLKNPDIRPSYIQGLEGASKSPDTRPINPDTRPEVLGQNKKLFNCVLNDSTIQPCNEKNQKMVWHGKDKEPSKQSNGEWWDDYENAEQAIKQKGTV